MERDSLGDRMKNYERMTDSYLGYGTPFCARFDGRAFHTFSRGIDKPFDMRMVNIMAETTKHLVNITGAKIGYVQSDEISLVFEPCFFGKSSLPFGGRVAKLCSTYAAEASVFFNSLLPTFLPQKVSCRPTFDARFWNVPTEWEAASSLIWRQADCVRNSISGLAQANFSHKQLQDKSCDEMQEMLHEQKGINWNDMPPMLKRGRFFKRQLISRKLTIEELDELPPKHNARLNPDMVVVRHRVDEVILPSLNQIANLCDVIFRDAEPVKKEK